MYIYVCVSVTKATVPGSFEEKKIARERVYTHIYAMADDMCNMCACAGVPVYEWGKCTCHPPPYHRDGTRAYTYPYLIDFVEGKRRDIYGRTKGNRGKNIGDEVRRRLRPVAASGL